MRWLVSSIFFASAVAFGTQSVWAQDAKAKAIKRGEQLYATQKCGTCHSIAGKGNKKGPLDGVGSKLKEDEIRLWLVDPDTMAKKAKSTRKPVMKSYAKLPKEDIDALAEYMDSLKKQ